jgi:hypothetical protein
VVSCHFLVYLQTYIIFDTGQPNIEVRNESIMVILDTVDMYSNVCEVYSDSDSQVQDAIQQTVYTEK